MRRLHDILAGLLAKCGTQPATERNKLMALSIPAIGRARDCREKHS
jgi:hypothetical protein